MKGVDSAKAAAIEHRMAGLHRDWTTDDVVRIWIDEDVCHAAIYDVVARLYVDWSGHINRKCRREGDYRQQKLNLKQIMPDGTIRRYWVLLERATAQECADVSNEEFKQRKRHDRKMKDFIDDCTPRFGREYRRRLAFNPDDIQWIPDEEGPDDDDQEGDPGGVPRP